MIFADLMTRLPEHTLMLADRLSMAHGLEVRSPLLDVELAEFALSMPPRLRVGRGRTKVGLRRAVRSWLPASLLNRRKQGFMFPVAHWLGRDISHALSDHLTRGPLIREGWIQRDAIELLVGEHARGQSDHHVRLWQLASLDAWHRIYMGRVDPGELSVEFAEALSRVPARK
jgi:asparagine synthase (glutamine-hydrolysing)